MATLHPEISSATRSAPFHVVFYNPRGLRPGWRLLIFVFMLWLIFFGAQQLIRRAGPGAGPQLPKGYLFPVVLGLSDLILFLVVLLVCWIMSRIERQRVGVYGLPLRRHAFARFWTGCLFWGFLPLTLLLLIMRALHVFYFGNLALRGREMLIWGALWALTFLMVGLFEEFTLRGYALHTLAEGIGFWPAAIVLAVIFAWGHMGNSGETHVGVIATAVFALFAAATLRATGDLWLAVGAHAGWNWGQSFVYGVNDSGLQAPGHLLNSHQAGPDWLTGGSVGPEGSALTLVLWAAMTIVILVLYRKRPEPVLTMPIPEPAGPPAA
ncbi:MAG TPA: CPBP family intramembrane glutamic endopeptidase [Candidatus Angelobacter sp.]